MTDDADPTPSGVRGGTVRAGGVKTTGRPKGIIAITRWEGQSIMIKNERQYRITKSQAKKFARALSDLAARPSNEPLMTELESNALRSQLDDLQQQLREYDELRSGVRSVIPVKSFDELPSALVQARIAAGLSQKELADRLGIKEQQVQRYESTDYHSASLARIREVVHALDVTVDRDFALRRPLPPAIAPQAAAQAAEGV